MSEVWNYLRSLELPFVRSLIGNSTSLFVSIILVFFLPEFAMADQEIIEAVKGLTNRVESLKLNLCTSQIVNFDGDSKAFKRWINSLEKHAMLEGSPIERVTYHYSGS